MSSSIQFIPKAVFDQQQRQIEDLKFQHEGKTYQITFIKQRILGTEGDGDIVDLSKLGRSDKERFIAEAQKILAATKDHIGTNPPHSVTFTFTHTPNYPTILNNTLGRVFNNTFGFQQAPVTLDTIAFKTTAVDAETTINIAKTVDPEDHAAINANFASLHIHITEVIHRKPKKVDKPKETPAAAAEKEADFAQTSNNAAQSTAAPVRPIDSSLQMPSSRREIQNEEMEDVSY